MWCWWKTDCWKSGIKPSTNALPGFFSREWKIQLLGNWLLSAPTSSAFSMTCKINSMYQYEQILDLYLTIHFSSLFSPPKMKQPFNWKAAGVIINFNRILNYLQVLYFTFALKIMKNGCFLSIRSAWLQDKI